MNIEQKLQLLETCGKFLTTAKANSKVAQVYENVVINTLNNIFATENLIQEIQDADTLTIVEPTTEETSK